MRTPECNPDDFMFKLSAGHMNDLYAVVAANIDAEYALQFDRVDGKLDAVMHTMSEVLYRTIDPDTYSQVLVYIRDVQIGADTLVSVVCNTTNIDVTDFSERRQIDQYLIDRTYRGVSHVQTHAIADRDEEDGWRPLATRDNVGGIGPRLDIMFSEDDLLDRLEVAKPQPPYALPEVSYCDLTPLYDRSLTRRIKNRLNITDSLLKARMSDVMLARQGLVNIMNLMKLLTELDTVRFEEDVRLPHQ